MKVLTTSKIEQEKQGMYKIGSILNIFAFWKLGLLSLGLPCFKYWSCSCRSWYQLPLSHYFCSRHTIPTLPPIKLKTLTPTSPLKLPIPVRSSFHSSFKPSHLSVIGRESCGLSTRWLNTSFADSSTMLFCRRRLYSSSWSSLNRVEVH